jgi:hypothetical protein
MKTSDLHQLSSTLFVVELDKYVVLTDENIKQCVFPAYRFDGKTARRLAYKAADDIALAAKKQVANMVEFPPDAPFIYDPSKIEEIEQALMRDDGSDIYDDIQNEFYSH